MSANCSEALAPFTMCIAALDLSSQSLQVLQRKGINVRRCAPAVMAEIGRAYRKHFSPGYVHYLARKFEFEVKKVGYYKAKDGSRRIGSICSAPYLGRIGSAYLVAIIQKENNHGHC
jgi:hypothetical protein